MRCHLVDIGNILLQAPLSLVYDAAGGAHLKIGSFDGAVQDVRSSWNRRIPRVFTMPSDADENDREYVRRNTELYIRGVLALLDERFPVNPLNAFYGGASKLLQLKWAKLLGLKVPDTIISNKADEILSFLNRHTTACVKPYVSHTWVADQTVLVANTAIVSRHSISDLRSVELMSHIYQQFISKKYEFRLTVFGQYASCTRIRTDKLNGASAVDWRTGSDYLKYSEPYNMDRKVVDACRRLLAQLGLRFGTFDLAEDSDGNIVFFEVNQAGQWLWQEYHCADCILLQPFAEYLVAADDRFTWCSSSADLAFAGGRILDKIRKDQRYSSFLEDDVQHDQTLLTIEQS